jgi:hypothetical protein
VKLGRDGRFSVANIAGDITVTTTSGDEVSIEAVKRTTGDREELSRVQIVVDERPGRVEVRTEHEQNRRDRERYGDHVSVEYTIVMPATASLDMHSVSGSLKVTGLRGAVRAETISGDVNAIDSPKLEVAKSVSGNVTLSGVSTDGDLSAGSISGTVSARSLKVHALDLNTVSGNVKLTDVTCDRLGGEVGQRRRRVRRHADAQRVVRVQRALGHGSPDPDESVRVRIERQQLQRVGAVRPADDHRRRHRPRPARRPLRNDGKSLDARDLR